ncbi:MAG: ANTAR domain-containing protein [Actinomycetota bacterium]|nr:ANTAR domain-containing protein [Actinomycetota bacterium]
MSNKNPIKLGEGIAGRVALENKYRVVPDILGEDTYIYKEIARKEGLISLCHGAPLHVKGKVIGVLNLYTSEPHQFSDYEVSLLKTVADQAAIVIENYRLVVESKVIKEELETRKVLERAKGILMEEHNLTENNAFKKIQKFAMDKRKSLRDVAEAIILSHEMQKE